MLDSDLGKIVKKRRLELGFSLRELAVKTDLTASFLSQVENNKTSLSLDSLKRISESLGVPLFYLLAEDNQKGQKFPEVKEIKKSISKELSNENSFDPVVRKGQRPKLIFPIAGVEYEKLVAGSGWKMEAICARLSPGTGNIARRLREPTEEFIYVISGELLVGLDQGEYLLTPGSTIYFEGESLQKLVCVSKDEDAVWISVFTPAVF